MEPFENLEQDAAHKTEITIVPVYVDIKNIYQELCVLKDPKPAAYV